MTYECTKNQSISSMKRKLKDFLKSPKLIVLEKLNKMSNLGNAIIFNVCEKLYKNKKKKTFKDAIIGPLPMFLCHFKENKNCI